MKNFLKDLMAFRISRHNSHRNMVHRIGQSVLTVHRGRTLMVLGGLTLLAEALRRRHQSKQLPQAAE